MEERRLLLALALSILVMTAWSYWVAPKPGPRPAAVPSATPAAAGASPRPRVRAVARPARPRRRRSEPGRAAASVQDERERRVEVESAAATVAFSNRGARLLSWQLKKHKDARGRGEEMVPAARQAPWPLDLETGAPEIDRSLREALFRPSAETLDVTTAPEAELVFAWAEGDLEAEKALRFEAGGEIALVRASVRRAGQPLPVRVLWGPGLGNPSAAEKDVQDTCAAGSAPGRREDLTRSGQAREAPGRGRASSVETAIHRSFVPASAGELRRWRSPPRESAGRQAGERRHRGRGPPRRLFVGPRTTTP
jgi:hypothetical protein